MIRWCVAGLLLALLLVQLSECHSSSGTDNSDPPPSERDALEKKVNRLREEMIKKDQAGQLDEARQLAEQVLATYRALYSPDWYPDGHPALAASLNNLGYFLQASGRPPSEALTYYEFTVDTALSQGL